MQNAGKNMCWISKIFAWLVALLSSFSITFCSLWYISFVVMLRWLQYFGCFVLLPPLPPPPLIFFFPREIQYGIFKNSYWIFFKKWSNLWVVVEIKWSLRFLLTQASEWSVGFCVIACNQIMIWTTYFRVKNCRGQTLHWERHNESKTNTKYEWRSISIYNE